MSAATALALEKTPRRSFPRHPINVPLDLIALRSGVPENSPGRCTDISEAGIGAVIAGHMMPGQQVAVELRLPNVGVPVRARALVRYQSRLRCGLEFVGLSAEQREMIRYFVYRAATAPSEFRALKQEKRLGPVLPELPSDAAEAVVKGRGRDAHVTAGETPPLPKSKRTIRIARRALYWLAACTVIVAALGWWQWQRSWNELERHAPAEESAMARPHG
jgi:PilZ domain